MTTPDENPSDPRPGDDKPRPISDISRHFLSAVRPGDLPQRTPPGEQPPAAANEPKPSSQDTVDMTPDEYAQRYGLTPADLEDPAAEPDPAHAALGRPLRAIVGASLNGSFFTAAREYAGHLVRDGGRVGLIQIDAAEIRLHLVEHDPAPAQLPPERPRPTEGRLEEGALCRRIREALGELDYDVDRWLLLLPDPQHPEARSLVQNVAGVTLLARCSHEGVVAGYRALKQTLASFGDDCPEDISIALLDAADPGEARRVHAKLADVSQQFLDCPIGGEGVVRPCDTISEHGVLWLRSRGHGMADDPMLPPVAAHWEIVRTFLSESREAAGMADAIPTEEAPEPLPLTDDTEADPDGGGDMEAIAHDTGAAAPEDNDMVAFNSDHAPRDPQHAEPLTRQPTHAEPAMPAESDEIIDLPGGASDPANLLRATLAGSHDLAATTITAPMCPAAQIAVDRQGRLTLVAATDATLEGLADVSAALTWLTHSAAVIRMAVPQTNITDAPPMLRLLIDHRTASAEALRPLLATGRVTLVPYRTLRWSGRTGLLLNAA